MGHGSVLYLMQMLHAIKNFKFHIFIATLSHYPSIGIKSLLSHDLHAKILIFASVETIDYVDNCNCCD